MKETILAFIALGIGVGLGVYASIREFGEEKLPTRLSLAILDEKASFNVPSDGPKVVVEGGEIHDFGTMDRGSTGKHDFVFRNVGNAPLVLTMWESTCKCTAMSVAGKEMKKGDQQEVPPGDSFKVTLDWHIKGDEQSFSQSAEFKTNDPRREIVRLLIHGKTVQAVEPEDPEIRFTNVSSSEPAAAAMNLYSYRDAELKIVKHEWESAEFSDFLKVKFLPLSPEEVVKRGARGGVKMHVSLKSGLPLGRTNQVLVLTSNFEGIEPLRIPVVITVVGDLTLLGPRVRPNSTAIDLGAVEQKSGIIHTVYLLIKGPARDKTQVQVVQVEPDQWLKVSLGEPLTDSPKVKRIPIRIEIPAGAPPGNFLGTNEGKTGQIILSTTHPQIKQVKIYVNFLVRG